MPFKKIILFICFLFSYISVFAQTQVYVRVDKTYVEVKEEISLTLSVSSDSTDIKSPTMPSLPNFNIYSSGQSRNVSMINGKVSVNVRFNYILSPRFAGKSTIAPFTIEVGNKIYKTEPIDIEVYRAGQSNASSNNANQNSAYAGAVAYKDKIKNTNKKANTSSTNTKQTNTANIPQRQQLPAFFMTAHADKKEAYLNEQIDLRIRFYQSQSTFGNPQYDRPKMEGFIFEDIKTNQGYETLAGVKYHYIEFVTALFGILPGKATIGAAKVDYVPSNGVMEAFDMFFSSSSKPKTVDTDPIDIIIKPLPQEGKTSAFSGAVGSNFKIETSVDKPTLFAGDTLVLKTVISGVGNMRSIDALPPLDLGPSFRIYDSTSSSNSKITEGKLGGTKEFQTIIVPRTSGNFSIPAFKLQYFNPEKNAYETVSSQEIPLKVLPAKEDQQENSVQFFSQENAPQGKRVEKISSDIYYLKNEGISPLTKTLTAVKELGKYNYLLFVVIGLALLISFLKKGEIEFFSSQKTYLRARRKISKAQTMNDIAPALQEYLSAKQGQALGITTVAQSAKNLKLELSTSTLLNSFWQELEMLKYAPADTLKNTVALKQSVQKALNLLKQIEKEVK
jgi:hypothetical protein